MVYRISFTIYFLTASLLLIPSAARASEGSRQASPQSMFVRGNDYYEKGDYANAIKEYEKIVSAGSESGPVYYNIANAYFKEGKLGKAILNYERAQLLMPRDADLISNYKFALSSIGGEPVLQKGIWAWFPIKVYSGSFTIDELTWMSSGMYIAVILFLFLTIFIPKTRKYSLTAVLVIAVLIIVNLFIVWHKVETMKKTAVTVVPRAEALFGPFDTATQFFQIQEGMKVIILGEKDDWYKVKRADGKIGWIKMSEVERVNI